MPTVSELSKRVEQLENTFKDRLDNLLDKVTTTVVSKLDSQPSLIIKGLKDEIEGLTSSLDFLNRTVESLRSEKEELTAMNKSLIARNESLERRIGDLEQYSRKSNLEIKGVPFTQGENCMTILQTIASKIDCPVSTSDIEVVHRVPSASDTKHLLVRFHSRALKTDFISKARKARLNTSDIGFSKARGKPVFVNDHLTPQNKQLFSKALQLKKDKSWRFLWTDDCVIKARQSTDSRVFRIRCESDLAIFT